MLPANGTIAHRRRKNGHPSAASRNDNAELVTLLVGPAESSDSDDKSTPAKFEVRQDLLEQCSPFFRLMLSRPKPNTHTNTGGREEEEAVEVEVVANWKEGQTKIIEMPEDRPEDVKMLMQWLKSGGLEKNRLDVDLCSKNHEKLISEFLNNQPGLAHVEIDDAAVELYRRGPLFQSTSKAKPLPAPNLEPLINLYILADKYDIEPNRDFSASAHPPCSGLRRQIVHRIRAIWRFATLLTLDHGDIENLWTCVPVDTEGDMGLKHAFVKRLASEDFITLRDYFTVRSWRNDKQINLFEGSKQRENRVWHAEFLQKLTVERTFWEESELQEAYNSKIGY